jgi:hypothetical protein
MVTQDGRRLKGEFRDNQPHGKMEMRWPNNDCYIGEYVNGMGRHGRGKMTYSNGRTYDGDWNKDQPHGIGTLTYEENGGFYTGHWEGGLWNGQGHLSYPARKYEYKGGFRNHQVHGRGREVREDGTYEGDFVEDKRHGTGEWTFQGYKYSGGFVADQFQGTGSYTLQDGSILESIWVAGEIKQSIKYTDKEKNVYESSKFYTFMEKSFIKSVKASGRCKITRPDGTTCEGFCSPNGFLHGVVTVTQLNGKIDQEVWEEGKPKSNASSRALLK